MRSGHRAACLTACSVFMLLGSCKTEISYTTWEPIDYTDVLKSMILPSGRLVTLESPEFQSYIGSYMFGIANCLLTVSATLSKLALVAAIDLPEKEPDGGEWGLDGGILEELPETSATTVSEKGTFVYLDLACPGPYGEGIGRDFEYGSIRVESGMLNDFSLRNVLHGAHLLLSFNQCQTPAFTVDLQSAGYLLGGFKGIVIDLLPFPFQLGDIRATAALVTFSGASVLIDADEAGTFRDKKVEIAVVASNGSISCLFDDWGRVFFGCTLVD